MSQYGLGDGPLRILTVHAHPDDESFGPAAMLARYAAAGARIQGLFFTRGEHGSSSITPPPLPRELAALREQDLRDAAAIIGFESIEVKDYEDGSLTELPLSVLVDHVGHLLERFRPHVVFTFGPAGITRHPDHLAVHHATVTAFHQARAAAIDVRELYFDAVPFALGKQMGLSGEPDGNPNTFIDVTGYQQQKLDALGCHARHIVDAQRILAQLADVPQTTFTMYRAWPPVPEGSQVTELLEDPHTVAG